MPSTRDLATTAGAPPGSGANFSALKAKLAARGNVTDPGRLTAWIGRKKYGRKGMARLSAKGRSSSHASTSIDQISYGLGYTSGRYGGINMADEVRSGSEFEGTRLTCPACGHSGSASAFGASGTSLDRSPEAIRTPARGNHAGRAGFQPGSSGIQVRSGAGGAGLAGGRGRAVTLARRTPVSGPADVVITRTPHGTALVRHRAGGAQVAELRKESGQWVATVDGRDLPGRNHQRTALMEAVGTWNRHAATPFRAAMPLQGEPEQTPLMAEYGIPAIRMATPATGASAGPRVTMANGDSGGADDDGLTPRGQAIKKKLIARGFPEARATAFAKRSQNVRAGQFGQAAS